MVVVRKSAPKSRGGCQTCKTRHVKCDESQPRCQRCTSTGRICDEYGRTSSTLPSFPSGVVGTDSTLSSPRSTSPVRDIQELRSYDFFRSQIAPYIAGFFGSSTWNLVLQASNSEPAVYQAVVAIGALYERQSLSLQPNNGAGDSQLIETDFPLQQYAKSLSGLRRYLSTTEELKLDTVLACALIHISIEVIQKNYLNALIHLESSLQLLQQSSAESPITTQYHSNGKTLLRTAKVDSDLIRAFLSLDLQASTYEGMRAPAIVGNIMRDMIPARFYSTNQAKDVLDFLAGHLYSILKTTIEDCRYRKDCNIPTDIVAQVADVKGLLEVWNERFEKYQDRPTSRFSRKEQLAINILRINHRVSLIEAATCTQPGATIFDEYDAEFDEILTMAAVIIRARKAVNPQTLNFSLEMGVIYPLYWTAVKCREPWTRQRAMKLLRTVTFQEGVWCAAAQASIAEVAIAREEQCSDDESLLGQRPPEFARIHSIGTNIFDPVKQVAEVNLTQKLNGLDGPWYDHVEWVKW